MFHSFFLTWVVSVIVFIGLISRDSTKISRENGNHIQGNLPWGLVSLHFNADKALLVSNRYHLGIST